MEFIERIQEIHKLSAESMELLTSQLEEVPYAKKEIVVREGQRDDYTYFVKSGSVRGYVLRETKQVTLLFAFEGDLATIIPGLSDNPISKITIETQEDTVLLRISRVQLEKLFNHSVELANWGRKLIEKTLLEYEHYFINYFWADKTTQYQFMVKEHPELLQRVSLKELASYLDVTPQSLSRIRAQKSKAHEK